MYKFLSTAALVAVTLCVCTDSLFAQKYEKEVILQNLNSPTGIELDVFGNLYYSEIPTPGVGGDESENRVIRYQLKTKKKKTISAREPEPINIAADAFGRVYWTCKTAGVVIRKNGFGNGKKSIVLDNLKKPVGIAATSFLGGLVYTEVPTPGVSGEESRNSVNLTFPVFGSYFQVPIASGEPEPSDVAIHRNGTVYWTCKTAGVILSRSPSGKVSFVRRNLKSPTGLDMDFAGRLYYTEVPTPGVGGDESENRVVMFNPRTKKQVVISTGEPEPVDVAVSLDGRSVYWTCRTAGVIIRASR